MLYESSRTLTARFTRSVTLGLQRHIEIVTCPRTDGAALIKQETSRFVTVDSCRRNEFIVMDGERFVYSIRYMRTAAIGRPPLDIDVGVGAGG